MLLRIGRVAFAEQLAVGQGRCAPVPVETNMLLLHLQLVHGVTAELGSAPLSPLEPTDLDEIFICRKNTVDDNSRAAGKSLTGRGLVRNGRREEHDFCLKTMRRPNMWHPLLLRLREGACVCIPLFTYRLPSNPWKYKIILQYKKERKRERRLQEAPI